eukprot:11932420-Heterocapsa_arctica.AAC.1
MALSLQWTRSPRVIFTSHAIINHKDSSEKWILYDSTLELLHSTRIGDCSWPRTGGSNMVPVLPIRS